MSQNQSEVRELHFSVEGKYLSDLGQRLMIEKNWEKALKIIKMGLQGISTDQVIGILKGDYELGGKDNDISYFKKENKKFKKELGYVYAGYIRHSPRSGGEYWYRPYACVTDYGPKDFYNPGSRIDRDQDSPKKLKIDPPNVFGQNSRAMHYAKNEKDLTALLEVGEGKPIIVLFCRVDAPPFWMADDILDKNKKAQDSLNDFYNYGRWLEERGHFKWYGKEEAGRQKEALNLLESQRKKKGLGQKLAENREKNRSKWLGYGLEVNADSLKAKIIKQAGDDWYEFKSGDKTIRVPRAPFIHWCLSRTSGAHLAPKWKTVSPSGLKMMNDDPYHSDWIIGAGLELDAMLGPENELSDAAYQARQTFMRELLGLKCAVLSGRGSTESWVKVTHPKKLDDVIPSDSVLVLPSADPKYLPLVIQVKTGAVIVEKGGSVAHLVNVAREQDVRIVRVEKALKLYPEGTLVKVDCETGEVDVASWTGGHQ